MKIYRDNNVEIVDIEIDSSTTINNRLMVENTLTMRVELAEAIDLRINDYVIISGERYELYDAPQVAISKDIYSYDALFVGNLHRLDNWLLDSGSDENYFYYATLAEHLELILRAIGTKESGWSYTLNAKDIDASPKNIEYSSLSCLSALHKLAQEYKIEFDIKLKNIAVAHKVERVSDFEFAVGRGEGLYQIARGKISNGKIATLLYGLGSKMNMKAGQRLTFDERYVERNIDLYGLREDKVVFESIYPRHIGSLTRGAQQVEAGKVLWTVIDTAMDFDLKGQFLEEPKIVFTSGACAGLEFTITDYDHATKTITFKEIADESVTPTYVVPNVNRKPEIGDTYHYINILMPDSYVTNAKAELKAATVAELAKVSVPVAPYTIEIDPRFVKAKGKKPINGDLVRITNDEIGLDALIRVIAYTYPVINPNEISVTVCDNILISGSASLLREVRKEIAASGDRFHPLTGSKFLPIKASHVTTDEAEVLSRLFSKDFNPTLTGFAFTKDEFGRWLLEVDKIIARESLTVPELVKNRVTVANNQVWYTDNGIIETVVDVADNAAQRIITIAQERGGGSTFKLDDLLKCTYLDDIDGGLDFQTVKMTVLEVIEPYKLRVSVDENTPPPRDEMIVVRTGNRTNVERQNTIFVDGARPAMFYYVNVDSHLITEQNIAQATGNLKGFNFGSLTGGKPIEERFSNVIRGSNYQEGFFVQKSGNGLGYPMPADRGAWMAGTYYHYDRVSHGGSMWDCAVAQTIKEPSDTTTDWTKTVAKGGKGDKGEGIESLEIGGINVLTSLDTWTFVRDNARSYFSKKPDGSGMMELYNRTGESVLISQAFIRDGNSVLSFDIDCPMDVRICVDTRVSILRSNVEQYRSDIYFDFPIGFKARVILYLNGYNSQTMYIQSMSEYSVFAIGMMKFEKGTVATSYILSSEITKAQSTKLFQGLFANGKAYLNNAGRQDVVKRDDVWYSYVGVDNQVQDAWVPSNWEPFGASFESVATSTLLAENANLAEFIFKNGELHSQQTTNGRPNIILDGRTGNAEFNNATMRGKVTATSGAVGNMRIDKDGQLAMLDDSGNEVIVLNKSSIAPLAEMLSGNEDRTTAIDAKSVMATTAEQWITSGWHAVINSVATLHISGTLGIYVTCDNPNSEGAWCSAEVYLCNTGGHVFSLGSASCGNGIYDKGNYAEASLDFSTVFSSVVGSTYYIKVVFRHMVTGNARSNVVINRGSFRSLKVSSANQSYLGRGLAVIMSATEHLHYGRNADGTPLLTYRGAMDMPGVLAAGSINAWGTITSSWGYKDISVHTRGTGVYEIVHNIGHTHYSITANAQYSYPPRICSWYNKGINSVYIRTADGWDVATNNDFDFQITGRN